MPNASQAQRQNGKRTCSVPAACIFIPLWILRTWGLVPAFSYTRTRVCSLAFGAYHTRALAERYKLQGSRNVASGMPDAVASTFRAGVKGKRNTHHGKQVLLQSCALCSQCGTLQHNHEITCVL